MSLHASSFLTRVPRPSQAKHDGVPHHPPRGGARGRHHHGAVVVAAQALARGGGDLLDAPPGGLRHAADRRRRVRGGGGAIVAGDMRRLSLPPAAIHPAPRRHSRRGDHGPRVWAVAHAPARRRVIHQPGSLCVHRVCPPGRGRRQPRPPQGARSPAGGHHRRRVAAHECGRAVGPDA